MAPNIIDSRPTTPRASIYRAIFDSEGADRGRFLALNVLTRPFFTPEPLVSRTSGHTSPRRAARMIFLRLCATQTNENSPATRPEKWTVPSSALPSSVSWSGGASFQSRSQRPTGTVIPPQQRGGLRRVGDLQVGGVPVEFGAGTVRKAPQHHHLRDGAGKARSGSSLGSLSCRRQSTRSDGRLQLIAAKTGEPCRRPSTEHDGRFLHRSTEGYSARVGSKSANFFAGQSIRCP